MRITAVKVYPIPMRSSWLNESLVANPMSIYPQYKAKRSSWYGPMTSAVVRIETDEGIHGLGTIGEPKVSLLPRSSTNSLGTYLSEETRSRLS